MKSIFFDTGSFEWLNIFLMFISPACDSLKSDENRKQLSAANVLGSRLFVCLLILLLVLSLSSLGDTLDLSLLIQRLYIYLRTTLCLTCLINLSIFLERDIQPKYIDFLLKGNTTTAQQNWEIDWLQIPSYSLLWPAYQLVANR